VNAAGLRINELAEQQRRLQEALGQQQAQSERERAALRETFNSQMTEVRGLLLLQRSQQESIVTLVNEHYHQLRADLATQLISQEKQIRSHLHELETALAQQRQVVEQVVHLLSTQAGQLPESFRLQRSELEALLKQSTTAAEEALQQARQEIIASQTVCAHHIEQIEARQEYLTTQIQAFDEVILEWQQRADIYEQQIAALQACLQEEIQARKVAAPSQILYAPPKEPQLPEELTKTNGATLHIQS
jgi:hypothetical protein